VIVGARPDRSVSRLVAALLALAAGRAIAAPTCYTQACGSANCGSWTGMTTVVPASAFPDAGSVPIAMVDPNDGVTHRLIATLQGKIWVWDMVAKKILATPFLDLSGKVLSGGERGLLAMTVAPDYATSGKLWVYYTRNGATASDDGDLVLESYTRQSTNLGNAGSGQVLLVAEHSSESNHNGGWLAFGPDGMLYVSLGDGGNGCDQSAGGPNGQNVGKVLGKLLRLDVRGVDPSATAPECPGTGGGGYGIPIGNPFAGATAGCGEIWAYGLRNPWRFSFDRSTGDLFIGDVGQSAWEEVDWIAHDYYPLAPDGAMNFGWKCREGCQSLTCSSTDCPSGMATGVSTCTYPKDVDPTSGVIPFWDPIVCHENNADGTGSRWQSIIGGYRYRGTAIPSLAGRYLYGDAYCGQLWATTVFDAANPAATTSTCWDPGNAGLYSFSQDSAGELYLLYADGHIACLHNGGGCPWFSSVGGGGSQIFADGFESGTLAAWSKRQV
jgi:hypothetical protein